LRGTDGSNPSPSSEESDANLIPGSWLAPTWLAAALARGGAHIRLIHLATAEDRAFVHARHRLLEALPPFIDTTEETRPVLAGFTADLACLRLDYLDPDALELGAGLPTCFLPFG
jgi:hypothetical protein